MAAAARPYWTGFLKLSLVTIAVRLYSATTEKERIHFHRIHEPSGERVRYQNVVPGLGPVDSSEIVKGYEYQKGRYVTVEPADLEKLRLETTDTIDIAEFVDEDAVDPVYVDSPYYLVPDGSLAEDGYRVIRDALRDSGKAAIGQVVINTRERIVAIRPYGKGLLVNALRFPEEVRAADEFFAAIPDEPAAGDELAIMEQIIARRTRKFEPGKFVDHYQAALKELIEEKLAGQLAERPPERKPAQVINLMDALKRSLAEEGADKSGGKGRPRSAKSSRAQKSLLLPVRGGRADEPKAPSAEAPKRRKRAS
ncbi:MAG TPA: Ku protein [Stellaceae bacterium]|jgi:DNA end-binding protein Ku|nr:Ku protein [Stellaceae bacterium]